MEHKATTADPGSSRTNKEGKSYQRQKNRPRKRMDYKRK